MGVVLGVGHARLQFHRGRSGLLLAKDFLGRGLRTPIFRTYELDLRRVSLRELDLDVPSSSAYSAIFIPATPWGGESAEFPALPLEGTAVFGAIANYSDAPATARLHLSAPFNDDHDFTADPGKLVIVSAGIGSDPMNPVLRIDSSAVAGKFLDGLGLYNTGYLVFDPTRVWPAGPPPTGDKLAPQLTFQVGPAGSVLTMMLGAWTDVAGALTAIHDPPLPGEGDGICAAWNSGGYQRGQVLPPMRSGLCVNPHPQPGLELYFALDAQNSDAFFYSGQVIVEPAGLVVLDAAKNYVYRRTF